MPTGLHSNKVFFKKISPFYACVCPVGSDVKGIASYFLRHGEDWGLQRAAEAQWVEASLALMRIVIDLI